MVDFSLMGPGFPEADQSAAGAALRVDDKQHHVRNFTVSADPVFAVVVPVVTKFQGRAGEDQPRCCKIDAVLGEVRLALLFVPFERNGVICVV